MGHKFADIMFTESVQEIQREKGSRDGYSQWEDSPDFNHRVDEKVALFLSERDSFYMASVNENDWPYVQHRGGPKGFVKILDTKTLGFADFKGNRQYVSAGNFVNNNRIALFFMDYPNKRRLKLLGRIEKVTREQPELLERLHLSSYDAEVEQGYLIRIEAFDWNCPQHITPRYDQEQVQAIMVQLREDMELTAQPRSSATRTLGTGSLPLVISGMRQLTPRVRSFELRHAHGEELPPVKAGSHLTLPVLLESGALEQRSYSICSDPADRDRYEIAVLREEAGRGGSKAVHALFTLGLGLNSEPPENQFELHEDERPALLLAAGIGITPILAMAHELQAWCVPFEIHYAGRSLAEMAFAKNLKRLFGDAVTLYSKADGERLNLTKVLSTTATDSIVYTCGPNRFISGVQESADSLGIDPERIRFERFSAETFSEDQPFRLELSRSEKSLVVRADQSILEALDEAGIAAPSSCRTGTCRTCVQTVLDGEVLHRDSVLSDHDRINLMCPCVSRSAGEHLTLDL